MDKKMIIKIAIMSAVGILLVGLLIAAIASGINSGADIPGSGTSENTQDTVAGTNAAQTGTTSPWQGGSGHISGDNTDDQSGGKQEEPGIEVVAPTNSDDGDGDVPQGKPGNNTEPTQPQGGDDSTEPTQPQGGNDPTEPTQPQGGNDPTEPTKPQGGSDAEQTDPTEETKDPDGEEGIESTEPSQGTEPDAPSQGTEPADPSEPPEESLPAENPEDHFDAEIDADDLFGGGK